MFARIVEVFPKLEKKEEFLKFTRFDVLPILKKQPGSWKFCRLSRKSRMKRFS
jgi:hypothetical protein